MGSVKLYETLAGLYYQGDYVGVTARGEKALRTGTDDGAVRSALAAAYIQRGKVSEGLVHADKALETESSLPAQVIDELKFVRAYGLYTQRKLDEALEITKELRAKKSPKVYVGHLEAQILSRLGQYEEAIAIYKGMMDTSLRRRGTLGFFTSRATTEDPVKRTELITNLAYNLVMAGNRNQELSTLLKENPNEQTAEALFNVASSLIEMGNLKDAREILNKAQEKTKEVLEAEGLTGDDIADDLAGTTTQLAVLSQLEGEIEKAQAQYDEILSRKVSDLGVVAVASNNLAASRWTAPNRNLLNIAKKMKATSTPGLENRLTAAQRKVMASNRAILSMEMHRWENVRDELESLQDLYPEDDMVKLIQGSFDSKSKRYDIAEIVLKRIGDEELRRATLAQVKLQRDDPLGAANLLVELRDNPSAMATAAALYEAANEIEKATSALSEAATKWVADGRGELAVEALREEAEIFLRHGKNPEAVKALEELLRLSPNDEAALASSVVACSSFDEQKAAEYAERLPPLQKMTELNPAELEALPPPRRRGEIEKKRVRIETGTEEPTKKKKKKKNKLPKDYDPNGPPPDPERWLPKSMRSAYKKRRKRTDALSKGSQGAGLADTEAMGERMDIAAASAGQNVSGPSGDARPTKKVKPRKKKHRK